MNREIKSRAWVTGLTKEPTMIYQYKPWEFSIDFKGTLTIHDYMIGQSFEKDDYKLMQFTGLKDKNGKEIFEGDIDRYGYIVTYIDGQDSNNLGMNVGFYTQRDEFESWAQMEVGEIYEIIGNIYEHPELLEVDAK